MNITQIPSKHMLIAGFIASLLFSCSIQCVVQPAGRPNKGVFRFAYGKSTRAYSIRALRSTSIGDFKKIIANNNGGIPKTDIKIIYKNKEMTDRELLGKNPLVFQVIVPSKFQRKLTWQPRLEDLTGKIRTTQQSGRKLR